jgi:carboxymethylenebutenolidase
VHDTTWRLEEPDDDRVAACRIPGVPPTHRRLSIPFTSIVNIRGDRLYHEHIAWDQGTVLRQLGLLPEYLPFPYALPGGRIPAEGQRFEYRVPVAGVESARKLVDEHAWPSNEMMASEVREVPAHQPKS